MPRERRISSRSVAQNEPLPGLSMIGSPGSGASSSMMFQPGSPRTRILPQGPGSPMPAPMRRERQRLFVGQVREVGAMAFASVDDVIALGAHRSEQAP